MATHIAGVSWYGKKNYARVGYIYGALTLDDDGHYYVNGVDTRYDSTTEDYFNYPTRELEGSTGFKRIYSDPDITYHRMMVELEFEFDFLILKALSVLNITKKPAFTRTGGEFNFLKKKIKPGFERMLVFLMPIYYFDILNVIDLVVMKKLKDRDAKNVSRFYRILAFYHNNFLTRVVLCIAILVFLF